MSICASRCAASASSVLSISASWLCRRRRAAEPLEPGAALAVVGEEAMHIGPGNTAVSRDGAVGTAVAEAHQRPRRVRARAHPHMHLVALEGRRIGKCRAADFGERLLAFDHRVDLQQAKPGTEPFAPSMPSGSAIVRPSI